MMKKWGLVAIAFCTVGYGCKYPFEAELRTGDAGRLVVEGYIDISPDAITYINLSRTTPLNEATYLMAEEHAAVFIEDEDGNSFPLTETAPGNYESESLTLSQTRPYRLKILSQEKIYVSEFIDPIITPAIDSIGWYERTEGVQIHVSTHDPESKTKYYQWDYSEVWERTVPYVSFWRFENGTLFPRSASEIQSMQLCWKYNTGQNINVKSSESYSQDIIPQHSITLIPRGDERLNIRYNITVKQHALSQGAFSFYEILNKNGTIGTFSDPMPSELPGNISRLDAVEPVVGYVGVYTTQTMRLEILASELKPGWITPPACYILSDVNNQPLLVPLEDMPVLSNTFLPTTISISLDLDTAGAYMTPKVCADCRENGGTNIKPSFWN